ncbi:MAG: translocase [Candidatus Pelagibacter sp.]|nr:translocase [Candidatus Pelagibacter sp.]|tara:strand:+ start:1877 stop:2464 length:588 start_codon:yes stop_codon:yes gene_type:complete
MNNSFEYIDIILLAMIAGFIFLRLRGILGKRTGFEGKVSSDFSKNYTKNIIKKNFLNENFDDAAKEEFLKGAKIAYETIITDFASGNLKNIKMLLDKKIYTQFSEAVNERTEKGHISETTFIGINSAKIQKHEKKENVLEVTVEFVSEIISSLKDKEKNILSGDPKKIKTVQDCWKFSKDIRSSSPNWLLIDTQA